MSTEFLTATEVDATLELIVRKQLAIKELQEEVDTLKNYFRDEERLPAGTTFTSGKFFVKVTENKRIDDKLAQTVLGFGYHKVTKEVVDTKKARALLSESDLAKIEKRYENKVEVGML